MQRRIEFSGKVGEVREPSVLQMLRCMVLLCCAVLICTIQCVGQVTGNPLRNAAAITFDAAGNLYIADSSTHQVWKATLGGSLVLVAGNGIQGFAGDGGQATAAELNEPQGLAVDPGGILYIADMGNQRIRAVSPGGVITTLAGNGVAGDRGDGGPSTSARLRSPRAVAVDSSGAVLVCDTGNHRVRRIAGGVVTAFAGTGVQGFSGDGGPALNAEFDAPSGLAVSADGSLYVADAHLQRVRKVDASGSVSTFAGTGVRGFSGDGGPASSALLSSPRGLVWTSAGGLLIADEGNQRVRRVDAAGVISTIAGSGVEGGSADGAAGLQASVRSPRGVAVSSFGLPVVADALNATVREETTGGALFQPAALAPGRTTLLTAQGGVPITYGQLGQLSVSASGLAGLVQGQVQVSTSATTLGAATLSAASAQVPFTGLGAGDNQLTVTYEGDGLNPANVVSGINVPVAPLPVVATASSTQIIYGQPLGVLSGVVSGVLPQDADAVQATFGVSTGATPDVGTYPVTVSLTGAKAANYAVSLSPASGTVQIVKAPATVTLSSSGQAFAGLPMLLQASVVSTTSGAPTGTVQFLDGATVVATGVLHAGLAQGTFAGPVIGNHALSVQYLGDTDFLPATSHQTTVAVAALPDFLVSSAGPQTASAAGGIAAFSLNVSSQGASFTGAVTFSAAGLPAGATASFSPSAVVPGSQTATVTVTVQVPAAAEVVKHPSPVGSLRGRSGVVLASLGVLVLFAFRRRAAIPRLLCLALLFSGLVGCGARTVGEGTGGVLAQSYAVQITGTATNLAGMVVAHSVPLTLTVQP